MTGLNKTLYPQSDLSDPTGPGREKATAAQMTATVRFCYQLVDQRAADRIHYPDR